MVKLVEKGGVSIGMLETRNLSFDVRRTECVGQNIFPMMTPVSR